MGDIVKLIITMPPYYTTISFFPLLLEDNPEARSINLENLKYAMKFEKIYHKVKKLKIDSFEIYNESNSSRFNSVTQKFTEMWPIRVEKWKNLILRKIHLKIFILLAIYVV